MTILHFIVEVILLGLGFLGGFFYRKYVMDSHQQSLEALGKKILDEARKEADSLRKEAKLQGERYQNLVAEQNARLEQLAGMSATEAKEHLLQSMERELSLIHI